MLTPTRFAAVLLSCCLSGSATSAELEVRPITAEELTSRLSAFEKLGAKVGDVLLANEHLDAVLVADSSNGKRYVGAIMVTPKNASDGTSAVLVPTSMNWRYPEIGQSDSIAIIRLKVDDPRWTGEVVYQLHQGTPWIEVTTSLQNNTKNQTLEVPLVDEFIPPAGANVEDEDDLLLVRQASKKSEPAKSGFALVPMQPHAEIRSARGHHLMVGYTADDPEPSIFKRASHRLTGRSSPDLSPLRPVSVRKDWPRNFRDDDGWHRIAPGKDRQVSRRLVIVGRRDQEKTLVSLAKKTPRSTGHVIEPMTSAVAENSAKSTTSISAKPTPSATAVSDPPLEDPSLAPVPTRNSTTLPVKPKTTRPTDETIPEAKLLKQAELVPPLESVPAPAAKEPAAEPKLPAKKTNPPPAPAKQEAAPAKKVESKPLSILPIPE